MITETIWKAKSKCRVPLQFKLNRVVFGHPVFVILPRGSRITLTEFRFAPSTLRNFVTQGAAHEAAAGHALSEPYDY